ncbi:MAG TPA: AI-2E family transporter [Actinomycetota bacterium]|nr:AI-2E family transporter [Actinomycetota bacterium]
MDPVPEAPEDGKSVPLTGAQARGAEEVRPPLNHRFTGEMPTWIPRLLLTVVVAVFAAYATFMLIRSLRNLLVWLIAALFLSFALEPAVNYLVSRGWRRGSATSLVLLGLGLLGLVTIAAMVPLVIDQFSELVRRSPELLRRASEYTDRWFGIELQSDQIEEFLERAREDVADLAGRVASIGALILSLVFQTLTIGLFTYYLVSDGPRFRRAVCSVLTPRRQREVLQAWDIAIEKTGGYLYSRLLLAVVNAAATFVLLTALGVPFAAPLALWQGFVSQFIPIVGTYIAAAIPVLVALLEDPAAALIFLIFVAVYQQIENYVLSPRITARTMQLHPAVAFGAALAGGSVGGLIGAFMALPAAAVIQALFSGYLTRHEVVESELTREDEPAPDAGASAEDDAPEDGAFARLTARLRTPRGRAEAERTDTAPD